MSTPISDVTFCGEDWLAVAQKGGPVSMWLREKSRDQENFFVSHRLHLAQNSSLLLIRKEVVRLGYLSTPGLLVTTCADSKIRVWSTRGKMWAKVQTIRCFHLVPGILAVGRNHFATTDRSHGLRLWKVDARNTISLKHETYFYKEDSIQPAYMTLGMNENEIVVWSKSGKIVSVLMQKASNLFAVSFHNFSIGKMTVVREGDGTKGDVYFADAEGSLYMMLKKEEKRTDGRAGYSGARLIKMPAKCRGPIIALGLVDPHTPVSVSPSLPSVPSTLERSAESHTREEAQRNLRREDGAPVSGEGVRLSREVIEVEAEGAHSEESNEAGSTESGSSFGLEHTMSEETYAQQIGQQVHDGLMRMLRPDRMRTFVRRFLPAHSAHPSEGQNAIEIEEGEGGDNGNGKEEQEKEEAEGEGDGGSGVDLSPFEELMQSVVDLAQSYFSPTLPDQELASRAMTNITQTVSALASQHRTQHKQLEDLVRASLGPSRLPVSPASADVPFADVTVGESSPFHPSGPSLPVSLPALSPSDALVHAPSIRVRGGLEEEGEGAAEACMSTSLLFSSVLGVGVPSSRPRPPADLLDEGSADSEGTSMGTGRREHESGTARGMEEEGYLHAMAGSEVRQLLSCIRPPPSMPPSACTMSSSSFSQASAEQVRACADMVSYLSDCSSLLRFDLFDVVGPPLDALLHVSGTEAGARMLLSAIDYFDEKSLEATSGDHLCALLDVLQASSFWRVLPSPICTPVQSWMRVKTSITDRHESWAQLELEGRHALAKPMCASVFDEMTFLLGRYDSLSLSSDVSHGMREQQSLFLRSRERFYGSRYSLAPSASSDGSDHVLGAGPLASVVPPVKSNAGVATLAGTGISSADCVLCAQSGDGRVDAAPSRVRASVRLAPCDCLCLCTSCFIRLQPSASSQFEAVGIAAISRTPPFTCPKCHQAVVAAVRVSQSSK
uniref:Uncharacterized protein n=1 Tax=Palpitomonas bilix TaxID=652834 RepID=A0A7S3D7G9_9EUKA